MIRKPQSTSHTPPVFRGGFTIVELMVSIAIIFVLITAAFVAFKAVKTGSTRTESLNSLRQMMAGYNMYSGEHKQRLMPGYVDPGMLDNTLPIAADKLDLSAKLPGGYQLNPGDTGPYVWRLAPYLDNAWKTFMADYRSPALLERMELEYGDGTGSGVYGPESATQQPPQEYGIARFPSIGLNSIYLGGDSFHGGGAVTALSPWDTSSGSIQPRPNKIAATRVADVKNPAKLVVFAPTGHRPNSGSLQQLPDTATGTLLGYFELRAPFGTFDATTGVGAVPQWIMSTADGDLDYVGSGIAGVPIDRLGQGKINVGNLDGSTSTEELGRLAVDMSRWSPFAIKSN